MSKSKKDKRIIGVFQVDVFNVQVGVFTSEKNCTSYLSDLGCEVKVFGLGCYGQARVDVDDSGTPWFSLVVTDKASTETVVHECVHMADFIMDTLGIPTGVENTEVRAYLTADIFYQTNEVLNG